MDDNTFMNHYLNRFTPELRKMYGMMYDINKRQLNIANPQPVLIRLEDIHEIIMDLNTVTFYMTNPRIYFTIELHLLKTRTVL
jgi:hypothetical protein